MTLTLRKKTLVIVTTTLIALVIVLFFSIRFIVLNSFEDLEEDDVRRHVQRVAEAFDRELVQLSIKIL